MQAKAPARRRNALLDHMSDHDFALLEPNLRSVPLAFRQHLQETSRRIRTVYFVETGIASMVSIGGHDRKQTEIAVVGSEGMTGVPLLYGVERSPCEVFIQVEGEGQCIEADDLRGALAKSPSLHHVLLRFAYILNMQTAYTALANAHGRLEERLARAHEQGPH